MTPGCRLAALADLACLLLCFPNPAAATGQVEENGDFLRYLIPAIAYGATFYKHDSDGRVIFTRPYKGVVVTPLSAGGFYGIGISKQW